MNKRGQLAIFVIIALIIVAAVLVFLLYPKVSFVKKVVFTPEGFVKSCIEPEARAAIELIARQGGEANPEGFVYFNNTRIKYLCYTSENYKTCVVQQPKIREMFERELSGTIGSRISGCMQSLKEEYERQGYSVSLGGISSNTSIVQGKINILINAPMTVTKESSQTIRQFNIHLESHYYDIILTATNIIQFESVFGDSETTSYVRYYPDLKIKKISLSDSSKIYIVSNVVSGESYTFASRSLVWPPGYGD